mmetsp:Transcript_4083/g.11353  ORF Transcript_4083/g.11353 Transcript_4083/m.11353 type:complete len:233 (-) Transcript_4083:755-1453(-)
MSTRSHTRAARRQGNRRTVDRPSARRQCTSSHPTPWSMRRRRWQRHRRRPMPCRRRAIVGASDPCEAGRLQARGRCRMSKNIHACAARRQGPRGTVDRASAHGHRTSSNVTAWPMRRRWRHQHRRRPMTCRCPRPIPAAGPCGPRGLQAKRRCSMSTSSHAWAARRQGLRRTVDRVSAHGHSTSRAVKPRWARRHRWHRHRRKPISCRRRGFVPATHRRLQKGRCCLMSEST